MRDDEAARRHRYPSAKRANRREHGRQSHTDAGETDRRNYTRRIQVQGAGTLRTTGEDREQHARLASERNEKGGGYENTAQDRSRPGAAGTRRRPRLRPLASQSGRQLEYIRGSEKWSGTGQSLLSANGADCTKKKREDDPNEPGTTHATPPPGATEYQKSAQVTTLRG